MKRDGRFAPRALLASDGDVLRRRPGLGDPRDAPRLPPRPRRRRREPESAFLEQIRGEQGARLLVSRCPSTSKIHVRPRACACTLTRSGSMASPADRAHIPASTLEALGKSEATAQGHLGDEQAQVHSTNGTNRPGDREPTEMIASAPPQPWIGNSQTGSLVTRVFRCEVAEHLVNQFLHRSVQCSFWVFRLLLQELLQSRHQTHCG